MGLALLPVIFIALPLAAQQPPANPVPPVPDAPQPTQTAPAQTVPAQSEPPQTEPAQPEPAKPDPCRPKKPTPPDDSNPIQPTQTPDQNPGQDQVQNPAANPSIPPPQQQPDSRPCPAVIPILNLPLPNVPLINWYARFIDGPKVKPMTPKEKAWLAFRNVADPFNGLTILGSSAIAVGANSHSAYGPGMWGFARYVGVSYSQDITAEFFGTYAIPSIVHQDPHYHRMPTSSMKRRIAHAAYQVLWTQGDDGHSMPNYANLVGFAIDDGIANLYVPGRKTDGRSTAERYGFALATAPIDNYVSEFLPDLARHIHIQIVVIQHIIDQVANRDATNNAP